MDINRTAAQIRIGVSISSGMLQMFGFFTREKLEFYFGIGLVFIGILWLIDEYLKNKSHSDSNTVFITMTKFRLSIIIQIITVVGFSYILIKTNGESAQTFFITWIIILLIGILFDNKITLEISDKFIAIDKNKIDAGSIRSVDIQYDKIVIQVQTNEIISNRRTVIINFSDIKKEDRKVLVDRLTGGNNSRITG